MTTTRAMIPMLLCFDIDHEDDATEASVLATARQLVQRNFGAVGEERPDLHPNQRVHMRDAANAFIYPSDHDFCDTFRHVYTQEQGIEVARLEAEGALLRSAIGLNRVTDGDFNHYANGHIIGGVRWLWESERHECYQYATVPNITAAALHYVQTAGIKQVEIVTHKGGYKGMKTVWKWEIA